MKRSTILIVSGTASLITTIIISNLWNSHPNEPVSNITQASQNNELAVTLPATDNSQHQKTTITTTNNSNTVNSSNNQAVLEETNIDESLFNIDENGAVNEALQQAASQYADNIRFPIHSQPVRNLEDVRAFKPFEQSQVSTPFPEGSNDENPIRINAATDTFQYFLGDTINIKVEVIDAPNSALVTVEGTLSGSNGEIAIEAPFIETNQGSNIFTNRIDTQQFNSALLSSEMLVKLNVVVGNRDLNTTVPFRYSIAAAQVSGVQQSRPEGPELIVPVELTVFEDGYYFIRGLLTDQATGRPLIQLQAESRLTTGRGIINLKAHISALQAQQSEGPYLLQNINGYRGAEVGEALDTPTSVTQPQFSLDGFPFTDYDSEEFIDTLAQERLEFLNNLGTNDDSTPSTQ